MIGHAIQLVGVISVYKLWRLKRVATLKNDFHNRLALFFYTEV